VCRRSFCQLFLCYLTIIVRVSYPFFSVEFLEFLENETIIFKFGLSFAIDTNSSDEFVVSNWDFFLAINAWEDVFINIYCERHWFIHFKSFTIVLIKSLHFNNQNMWSVVQEFLWENIIVEAILTGLRFGLEIEVLVQLIGDSYSSFDAQS